MSIEFYHYPIDKKSSSTTSRETTIQPVISQKIRTMQMASVGQQLTRQATRPNHRPRTEVWFRYLQELYTHYPDRVKTIDLPETVRYDMFDWQTMVQTIQYKWLKQDSHQQAMRKAVGQRTSSSSPEPCFVLKMKNTTDRVIVVGDIHGGLHTLCRLMTQWHTMGIFSVDTFLVTPGYRIIFLGDILDRGAYSLEVFLTLLLIRYVNRTNDRFVQCKGNHEFHAFYLQSFSSCTTRGQLKKKLTPHNSFTSTVLVPALMTLPSAIVVSVHGTGYFLCHGAPAYSMIHQPDQFDLSIPTRQSWDILWLPDVVAAATANHPSNLSYFAVCSQLHWNDIHSSTKDTRGRNTSDALDPHQVNDLTLGWSSLRQFFVSHPHLHCIIRGHQDCYANALLLSTDLKFSSSRKTMDSVYESHIPIQDNIIETTKDRSLGHVATMGLSVFQNRTIQKKYMPVLTISTATGVGKLLSADSFCILTK